MNPLIPTGLDVFFIVLAITSIFLTVVVIVMVLQQERELSDRVILILITVLVPIIGPFISIFLILKDMTKKNRLMNVSSN